MVLAAAEARDGAVHPVYVRAGLAWEAAEREAVRRLLDAEPFRDFAPLVELTFTVRDLYPESHWALRGEPPGYDTPDEDVYLTGRNVALLTKTAVHCARRGIHRIAIGTLAGNPFPDATGEFLSAMAHALSLGLAHEIAIDAPFAAKSKADVIRLGLDLHVPFELTLSCMKPKDGRHCGRCSKCRERLDAFREAGVTDPAAYAHTSGHESGIRG